ncbi:hypothetical protein EUGRSUZ_B01395 [Eucalyptus grandis]|uniref:Uncharacterized protein n=2 Tax=Eucalyptus grandis TaxID=71139 RepID=A0ACC3LRT1_EUCGR|nr:hypothetical protein EUGRSUZ_B01395 [Eucalyptus grandis]
MGDDRACVHSVLKAEPLFSARRAPLTASYNDQIRPLLDAIDKLRNLMVMKEGIQLPTIVVVGDQSSGKSSVLESLANINLLRGHGICTRVPLIMRLQDNPHAGRPELYLEFNGKVVHMDEDNISVAINDATNEIAGHGKAISNSPLTLVVKKHGVLDLTMVDLPGITRVPLHGQPENIYEQISEMIMEYIRPDEGIILNVLSATVDFSTCESIRMSQMVDKTGKRTLAVVTKADKAPEGLLEKVTADDVNTGLGYVCVRNRIGDETYEEARLEEAKLFDTHPLLCKIDKSIVGVPVLAQKLTQIQAAMMAKCLPEIVKKINDKLNANVAELKKLPKNLSLVTEAMTAFMQILGSAKESLRKILLRGEFDEYPEEKNMHCTAGLVEMLNQYSHELQHCAENDPRTNFLLEELEVLEEAKGIWLPNFLPRTAFLTLLQWKVKGISSKPPSFVACVWEYIEGVVIRVLMRHCENYPQLQSSKLTDYTCNPEYMLEWNNLMSQQNIFMDAINDVSKPSNIVLQGIGEVDVGNLRHRKQQIQEAFDLKMRITAYWKFVQNLVNNEMEKEIVGQLIGPNGSGSTERMLEEAPSVAAKRDKLNKSIKLLRESAKVVAKIMDRIATDGEYSD